MTIHPNANRKLFEQDLHTVRGALNHPALAQFCYFILAEPELGQHLFGLLAEFRRARGHFAWCARKRHRLADEADLPAPSLGTSCAMPRCLTWASSNIWSIE